MLARSLGRRADCGRERVSCRLRLKYHNFSHKVPHISVAKACGVPRTRIERIAREELGISADTALRLGRFFEIEPEFWLNLQTRYDLETVSAALGRVLDRIASFHPRAA
jgi:addiction module HigA family antidote